MRDDGAAIGGEGNGGVILPEVHLGRDAPIGAALLLQLLHEENRSLSQIVSELPRYVIVKDKLDRPNASLDTVYEAFARRFLTRWRILRMGCGCPGRTVGFTFGRRARNRSCG